MAVTLNLSVTVFYFVGFFGVSLSKPVNVRKFKKSVNKEKQK